MTIRLNGSTSGYTEIDAPAVASNNTLVFPANWGDLSQSRNAIINGNPIINQRGYVSGTATSGGNQYTLDRWRVVTSGQSITWTDSGNVRTVTAPAGGVEQVIEGINLITGTYTLNWTGTATATVAGNAVTKGGNVSITGGTDTTLRFSSGTFSLVQLEPGTVASGFERRSYGQELALCQRYYEKSYDIGTPLGTAGFGNCIEDFYASALQPCRVRFQVSKRNAPTITIWDSAGNVAKYSINGVTSNITPAAVDNAGNSGFKIFTDGTAQTRASFHWSASAEL